MLEILKTILIGLAIIAGAVLSMTILALLIRFAPMVVLLLLVLLLAFVFGTIFRAMRDSYY